ncbi:MAG: hypothetical protein ACRCT1_22915 [Microcoleaceae cyanobacterium]
MAVTKSTTDKKIAEDLKQSKTTAKNGHSTNTQESAKVGANRITDFINDVSDEVAKQVADATTAAILQKAMKQLGLGNGPLTQAAMTQFSGIFTEVLGDNLPSLTGADGGDSQYFLPSALEVEKTPENLN